LGFSKCLNTVLLPGCKCTTKLSPATQLDFMWRPDLARWCFCYSF
jgi:hypothetical protein